MSLTWECVTAGLEAFAASPLLGGLFGGGRTGLGGTPLEAAAPREADLAFAFAAPPDGGDSPSPKSSSPEVH